MKEIKNVELELLIRSILCKTLLSTALSIMDHGNPEDMVLYSDSDRRTSEADIKASVNDDYLVCLEDGKKFKCLKSHLRSRHGLSPDQYRAKWGLPSDYPMVCKSYSEIRSKRALSFGLGRKRKTQE